MEQDAWLIHKLVDHDHRLAEVERWRASSTAMAKAICKRIMMLCAIVFLAVLANAFPNTTVATYADQFRIGLMRR